MPQSGKVRSGFLSLMLWQSVVVVASLLHGQFAWRTLYGGQLSGGQFAGVSCRVLCIYINYMEDSISLKISGYRSSKIVVVKSKTSQQFLYHENRTTGTKKRLRNFDFQASVTGISGEIDAS